MTTTLYVGGFATGTPEAALRALLANFGEIAALRIAPSSSRDGRTFAYVDFATAMAAHSALSLDGREVDGLALRVDLAR